MSKFAKLFDVEAHQVLLKKDFDSESEEDFLKVETSIDGLQAAIKLEGFKNESHFEKAFEEYDQEKAEKFFKTMKNLLTQTDEEE
tara:strand:+ start:1150 stop:1404 length:255 start_codon:yes stop_codon:yes gene_type:complete